jgi:hypothetical protein
MCGSSWKKVLKCVYAAFLMSSVLCAMFPSSSSISQMSFLFLRWLAKRWKKRVLLSPLVSQSALLFSRHLSSSAWRMCALLASKECIFASISVFWSVRAFCLCKRDNCCSRLFRWMSLVLFFVSASDCVLF